MAQSSLRRQPLIEEDYHPSNNNNNINNTVSRRESIVDRAVETAKVCNSLVLEYCSLCTVYIDKQVQYELIMGNPLENFISTNNNNNTHHNQHRQDDESAASSSGMQRRMMFDEDSVVDSVNSRR